MAKWNEVRQETQIDGLTVPVSSRLHLPGRQRSAVREFWGRDGQSSESGGPVSTGTVRQSKPPATKRERSPWKTKRPE